MNFIQVNNLCAYYADYQALTDISFTLQSGQVTAIIGESGAGKSTLIFALLGLLSQRGGSASGTLTTRTQSLDFHETMTPDWNMFRGGVVSLMPQNAHGSLDPSRTVKDQIKLATPPGLDTNIHKCLSQAGFSDSYAILHKYPHELSGGMARRVAFAQSLARSSPFLLADEPTQGLDPIHANAVLNQLKQAVDIGLGLVIVSHDLRAVYRIADQILVVHDGRIAEQIEKSPGTDLQLHSQAGKALQQAMNTLTQEKRQ